jgi:hypothetical protein
LSGETVHEIEEGAMCDKLDIAHIRKLNQQQKEALKEHLQVRKEAIQARLKTVEDAIAATEK